MASHIETKYSCDKCGGALEGWRNSLNIVTEQTDSYLWSRLHVNVIHKHGGSNSGEEGFADLCQPCAVALLTDALQRVSRGERATAGTEDSHQHGWGIK